MTAFPSRYQLKILSPGGQVEVFSNWLDYEAMDIKVIYEFPILNSIKGSHSAVCTTLFHSIQEIENPQNANTNPPKTDAS